MFSASGVSGVLEATATSGRGLNAREITDMAMRKVMFVSDTAPQPIRDQALAFRERIDIVIEHYVAQAQKSERTTICGILEQAGHHDAAELIRRL